MSGWQGKSIKRLHAPGREMPAALGRGAAPAHAALSAGSCPGVREGRLLPPSSNEKSLEEAPAGSGRVMRTVATGWQQKLVDPAPAWLRCLLWWTSSIIGSKSNHFIVWRNFLQFSIQRPALVFQADGTKIEDNGAHTRVLCPSAHGFPPAGHGHSLRAWGKGQVG